MGRTSRSKSIVTMPLLVLLSVGTSAGPPRQIPFETASDGGDGRTNSVTPFGVGEEMLFDLSVRRWPFSGSGEARLAIEEVDTVRGEPTFRMAFSYEGGIIGLNVDNTDRSWLDVDELFSRRFEQKHQEPGHRRDRTYEFLPEEMKYRNLANVGDSGALATARPLDDVSFLYYVRTLPLVIGDEYTEARYYKAEGNPVTVRVLRSETIQVPAGTYEALVIEPIIRTNGLFKDGGEAEIWISNDPRRILLKVVAKINLGATLTMELREYRGPS